MFDDARAELHAPKQEIALLANALNLLVPMSTDDGEFHGPSILEFFPDPIAFEGTPFEINRIILVRWVAVIALLLVFWLGTRRLAIAWPMRPMPRMPSVLPCRLSVSAIAPFSHLPSRT